MSPATGTSSKASARVLDMTDVKDRSAVNPKNVPEGDYVAVIDSVTEGESNAGNEQWIFILSLVNHPGKGTYPYYCQTDDNLWKVRNLIQATGTDVPKRKVKVDPNKLVGKEVGVTMEDDEYEGRMKSVIANVFPPEEVEDEPEAEEEVVTSKSRRKPATKPAAKKTPTRSSSRNRKPPVDDDEDVDDEEMEALELDDL